MKKVWIYKRTRRNKCGKVSRYYEVMFWHNGKQKIYATCPTKALATSAMNLCIQKLNSNVYDSITTTIESALAELERKYKMEKSEATAKKCIRSIRRFLAFSCALRIEDIHSYDLMDYAEHRSKEAVPSTVRYDIGAVRVFLKYCQRAGYIAVLPDFPQINKGMPKKGQIVEIDDFVAFCKKADPDTRLSCIVGLVTGLRTMDVRRLTKDNIKKDTVETVQAKTKKLASQYIPPILQAMLADFDGFDGISQRAFQGRVTKYSKSWTFHDLRRTHAQLLRDADSGLIFAKNSLGHSSTKTTEGFYAKSNKILIDRIFTPILQQVEQSKFKYG